MQNITSVVGKLLYFARHLNQTKQINQIQLASLKDLILTENEDIMAAYEQYIKDGTELTLTSSLLRVIHHENSQSDGNSQSSGSKKVRSRKGSMKIIIPKRNIQKMPAGMGRI